MLGPGYSECHDYQQSDDFRICPVCPLADLISLGSNFFSDGGLPASKFFATVHPTLKLPLNALILTVVVVICFGCIFLGSSR